MIGWKFLPLWLVESFPICDWLKVSRISQVFTTVAELLGQLVENIFEDYLVNILAEEVEQEPVAHRRLFHHHLHALRLHPPVAQLEQVGPEGGGQAEAEPVDHHQGGEAGQAQHPEPEEDVDLLVEDVEWKDTESVMLL